jgi:hypothetical protein
MSDVVQGLEKVMEMTFLWEMPITTPRSPLRGNTRVTMTNRTTASNVVPQLISRHIGKPSIQTPISPSNANPPITSRHVTKPPIRTPISPFRITTHPATSLTYINPNSPLPLDSSSKKKMQLTSTAKGPTEPFTLRNHRFSIRLPKMPWSS